jgi:competence protein ComEA
VDVRKQASSLLESLADRLGVSAGGITIGALCVAAAGLAGWWAFATPTPPPVEDVLPRIDGTGPLVTAPADAAPTTIVVHVDGGVVRPGVPELESGARVIDAIEAAAGLTPEADRGRLNLAAPVADGQRVWVPVEGEDEPAIEPVTGGVIGSEGSSGGVVNLNRADQAALETLPGVGPSIAAAILQHREREGAFERVEDLLEVAGIGPSRLAQLEPLVSV